MILRLAPAVLTAAVALLFSLGPGEYTGGRRAAAAEASAPADAAAARCLYLPPALEERVVFYHPFEDGPARPIINRLGGRFDPGTAAPCEGLAGRGIEVGGEKPRGPLLSGLALPMHRPITVMLWWQLRRELPIDGGLHVATLRGPRGYVSNFVRSGPWCALKEPNFVLQVWNWPGISNVNAICGPVERRPGPWRHAALVVSRASTVRVLWDGHLRAEANLKGRTFLAKDAVDALAFGPEGYGVPMRLDELLVLDVALDDAAVSDYLTAVRALAGAAFPVLAPAHLAASSGGRQSPGEQGKPDGGSEDAEQAQFGNREEP